MFIPESYFCCYILYGRKSNAPRVSTFCQKDELPSRGLFRCTRCGRILTGGSSKRTTTRYHYYHCNYGCEERFRAEEANNLFYDVLKSISGNEKIFRCFEPIMENVNLGKGRESKAEMDSVKSEIDICRKRLEKAQTLMLDGQ